MKSPFYTCICILLLSSCQSKTTGSIASGNFETDEIIVSAEQSGKILQLAVREGDTLAAATVVGQIDMGNTRLQKEQVEASIQSLRQKTNDPAPQLSLVRQQIKVQEVKLQQLSKEKARTEKLLAADAATKKQLDDIGYAIEQLQQEMSVSRQQLSLYQSNIGTQNRTILSEAPSLEVKAAQLQDLVNRGVLVNPIKGTVLNQYAFSGEITMAGKPLYSIANLDTLTLRAYISGTQLPAVRLGQPVSIRIDQGKDQYKSYNGTIYWVSDKSEFTPKTIQTKDERANLVYAVKVRVPNDGLLKIGMYGEMLLP